MSLHVINGCDCYFHGSPSQGQVMNMADVGLILTELPDVVARWKILLVCWCDQTWGEQKQSEQAIFFFVSHSNWFFLSFQLFFLFILSFACYYFVSIWIRCRAPFVLPLLFFFCDCFSSFLFPILFVCCLSLIFLFISHVVFVTFSFLLWQFYLLPHIPNLLLIFINTSLEI